MTPSSVFVCKVYDDINDDDINEGQEMSEMFNREHGFMGPAHCFECAKVAYRELKVQLAELTAENVKFRMLFDDHNLAILHARVDGNMELELWVDAAEEILKWIRQ